MNVLIACEFSGIVRDAFVLRGHNAYSADLLGPEDIPIGLYTPKYPDRHLKGDLFLEDGTFRLTHLNWDLIIAHPPCTHLSSSGARWFAKKESEQRKAIRFFLACWNLPARKIAVENPIGIMSTYLHSPHQIIQPWQFGHSETKATCLWLKNLPLLQPSDVVGPPPKIPNGLLLRDMPVAFQEEYKAWRRVWYERKSPDRWAKRSLTYLGIADAMAAQWGAQLNEG